jgi:hypothetical protein
MPAKAGIQFLLRGPQSPLSWGERFKFEVYSGMAVRMGEGLPVSVPSPSAPK